LIVPSLILTSYESVRWWFAENATVRQRTRFLALRSILGMGS